MARPPIDERTRFNKFVVIAESGCHEWQSTIQKSGYGRFYFRGKQYDAHRAAYILYHGNIPDGLHICHTCDNRLCVNELHLYAGTAKQNVRDKVERCKWWGRMTYSNELVEKCRELYKQGFTQTKISEITGIDQTTISKYVRNKQRVL